MFVLETEDDCPRCHTRMITTAVMTHDFTTCGLTKKGTKVKCEYVHVTTESRKECPQCGIRIHVSVPHLKGE